MISKLFCLIVNPLMLMIGTRFCIFYKYKNEANREFLSTIISYNIAISYKINWYISIYYYLKETYVCDSLLSTNKKSCSKFI